MEYCSPVTPYPITNAWLRSQGLSTPLGRRRVVVWSAVLERIRGEAAPAEQAARPTCADRVKPLAVPGRILD